MKKIKSFSGVVCHKNGMEFVVIKDNHKLFTCKIEGEFGQNQYAIIENCTKLKCDTLKISTTQEVCFDNKKIYCNVSVFDSNKEEDKVSAVTNATAMLNILKKNIEENHAKMLVAQKTYVEKPTEENDVAMQVAINRYEVLQDLYIAYNGKVYKF